MNAAGEGPAPARPPGASRLEALIDAVLQGERLAETGRALIEHVRFEERELFPRVEVFLEQAVS